MYPIARVRLGVLALGMAAAVLVGASGCGTGGGTTPPAPAGTTTAAAAATPTAFAGDLRSVLLARPSGATATVSPNGKADGSMTIEDIVATFDSPEQGRSSLQKAGFKQGAQIEWIEADKTWIGIFLYQFGDETKAKEYGRALQNGFRSNDLFGSCVAIDGVLNGCTFSRKSISDNGRWFSEAVYSKRDIVVEIFSTGPEQVGTQRLMDYAKAQYALIP